MRSVFPAKKLASVDGGEASADDVRAGGLAAPRQAPSSASRASSRGESLSRIRRGPPFARCSRRIRREPPFAPFLTPHPERSSAPCPRSVIGAHRSSSTLSFYADPCWERSRDRLAKRVAPLVEDLPPVRRREAAHLREVVELPVRPTRVDDRP